MTERRRFEPYSFKHVQPGGPGSHLLVEGFLRSFAWGLRSHFVIFLGQCRSLERVEGIFARSKPKSSLEDGPWVGWREGRNKQDCCALTNQEVRCRLLCILVTSVSGKSGRSHLIVLGLDSQLFSKTNRFPWNSGCFLERRIPKNGNGSYP